MSQQHGQALGDTILSNMAKTFEFAMEYGTDGKYTCFTSNFSSLILFFARFFPLTDTKNSSIYKNLAKKLCSIEHNYFVERDRLREAAKQSTVDGFDEVINQNIIQVIVFVSQWLYFPLIGIRRQRRCECTI